MNDTTNSDTTTTSIAEPNTSTASNPFSLGAVEMDSSFRAELREALRRAGLPIELSEPVYTPTQADLDALDDGDIAVAWFAFPKKASCLPDLPDDVEALIAEIVSRPFPGRQSIDIARHNTIMLETGLRLAARGLTVTSANRAHPEAGTVKNLRRWRKAARKGIPPAERFVSKAAKFPLSSGWQNAASADFEEIKRQFDVYHWRDKDTGKEGDVPIIFATNLSIVTGERTGYFVLDVDGEVGRRRLKELEAERGALPVTPQSISGSGGGDHYILRLPPGVRLYNTAKQFGGKGGNLDIRGERGQIIAAPSLHASGGLYQWAPGRSPDDVEIADAPAWVIEEAIQCSKKAQAEIAAARKAEDQREASDGDYTDAEAYEPNGKPVRIDGKGFEAHLESIGDGEGQSGFHDPIYSAACSYFIRNGVEADLDPLKDVLRLRIQAATKRLDRPKADIDRYISDAYLNEDLSNAREFARSVLPKPFGDFSEAEAACTVKKAVGKEERLALAKRVGASGFDEGERNALLDGLKMSGLSIGSLRKVAENAVPGKMPGSQAPGVTGSEDYVTAMNAKFAVYEGRGKVSILHLPSTPGKFPNQLSKNDFMLKKEARPLIKVEGGEQQRLGEMWLDATDRRDVTEIAFEPPGSKHLPLPADYLNAFNGWPRLKDMSEVDACTLEGMCRLYLSHWRDVICGGDEGGFRFVLDWFADLFQVPGHKVGSSLLIVGGFGSGKSTVWEVLRPALGDYLLKVNQADDLKGNFNDHTVGKLLIVSEEATYAGDTAGANTLKDITTSDDMLVKTKFHSAYRISSYSRLLYIANDLMDAVKMSEGDRRVTVFKATNKLAELRANNPTAWKAYNAELRRQMDDGGLDAFVELMRRRRYDPDRLRQPYETDARREMLRNQMDAGQRWAIDFVRTGQCGGGRDHVGDLIDPVFLSGTDAHRVKRKEGDRIALPQTALRAHFLAELKQAPERFARSKYGTLDNLGDLLADMLGADPDIGKAKINNSTRWCWFVPQLDQIVLRLTERGFLRPKSTTPDGSVENEAEPAGWTVFGAEVMRGTDGALAALRHFSPDHADTMTAAITREREQVLAFEEFLTSTPFGT